MYWVEKFHNLCSGKTIRSIRELDMHSANTRIEIVFTDDSKIELEWDYMYEIAFYNESKDKEIIMS